MPLLLELGMKELLDGSGESSWGKRRNEKSAKSQHDRKSKRRKQPSREKASSNDAQLHKGWKILKLHPVAAISS